MIFCFYYVFFLFLFNSLVYFCPKFFCGSNSITGIEIQRLFFLGYVVVKFSCLFS